jgi:chromosome segregation ATPase
MERLIITNTPINSGLGDTLKEAFDKVNDNFEYLFDNSVIENLSQLNNDVGFITASSIPTSYEINEIVGLTSSINNLQSQINQLGASYSITEGEILSIQEDINSINDTISSINSIINNQNEIISELQSQINDIYNIIN